MRGVMEKRELSQIEKINNIAENTNYLLKKLVEIDNSNCNILSNKRKNDLNYNYSIILEEMIDLKVEGKFKTIFDGIRAQAEPIELCTIRETIVLLQNLQTVSQNYSMCLRKNTEQVLFDWGQLARILNGKDPA